MLWKKPAEFHSLFLKWIALLEHKYFCLVQKYSNNSIHHYFSIQSRVPSWRCDTCKQARQTAFGRPLRQCHQEHPQVSHFHHPLVPNGRTTDIVFVTLFCIAVRTAIAWSSGQCAMLNGHCLTMLLFCWQSTAALVFQVGACFEVLLFCPPFPTRHHR